MPHSGLGFAEENPQVSCEEEIFINSTDFD